MANKSVGLLTIAFGADLRGFDKAMKKAQRSIKKFGTSMQRTGETLTRSITIPVIGLGAAAVKMASDFEETDAKFKTVFSSIQREAEATAKVFKSSFGLSSKAAKQMLGDTGDLLVGFGFTEREALNLSKQVNELAVDLASFTNFSGGAEGASLALTKALLGERESIKSLGIAITEADLKSFAADQGKVFKELTRVEKATLTYQLALKQSSKAVGDFARTSGGFANQTRILAGDLNDLGVEIGTMLLPVAQKILQWAKGFVASLTNMDPVLKTNIANFALLAAAIGPLLSISGSLIKVFARLFSRSGLIVMGLAAIVAGFAFVVENYEAFKERLSDWTWWRNALVDAAADFVDLLGGRMGGAFGISDKIRDLKVDSKEYIHEFGSFADAIKNQAKDLAEAMGFLSNPFSLGGGGGGANGRGDDGGIPFLSAINPQKFIGPLNQVGETIAELTQKQKQFNAAMGMFENIMTSAMTSAAYSTEGFFKSFMNNIKIAIKQLLVQLAVITAIKFLIGGPGVSGSLSKAFELAKGKVLGLATGGLVTGPTMALVGEGAGTTASNPEVVAPLDRLKSMINGGGSQQVEVYGRISGNDIFISNQRGSLNRQRSV